MSYYVCMTDKFMSGWGCAAGKTNKMVIVCDTWEQAALLEKNAKQRSEMRYMNIALRRPSYSPARYLVSWKVFADMGGPWLA